MAGDLARIFQCSDGLETNQKKSCGWRYVSSLRGDVPHWAEDFSA
jgi:hypothetical protein